MSAASHNRYTSSLVTPLSHFRRGDLILAGGKGANLGELSHAGFDVPPGFIITTAAYDLLLQNNSLHTRLRDKSNKQRTNRIVAVAIQKSIFENA